MAQVLVACVLAVTGALIAQPIFIGLALVTLIAVIHEVGHAIVARWCGISVLEFGIGFGPAVAERTVSGTRYRLNLVPLGGYVRLRGEDNDDDPAGFACAPLRKRLLVYGAGPMANVVFAFGLLVGIGLAHGLSIGRSIEVAGAIANLIVTTTIDAVRAYVPVAMDRPLDLPFGGLPSIMVVGHTLWRDDVVLFVVLIAALSGSVGIMNALPIPPLDGGQAVAAVISTVSKGRVQSHLRVASTFGLVVLVAIAVIVNGIDLVRTVITVMNR
jgi:regulator of sigma E protease